MKRQYLITERAHFMCPNMHFGIVLEVDKMYQKDEVWATLERMSHAHPFLKSLIANDEGTNRLYYYVTLKSQIQVVVRDNQDTLWEDYRTVGKQNWNVFENGLLKVYIYPQSQGMRVLFVIHHLLADGRGALQIAEEFANDYVGNVKPCYVEEQLMESIDDLPPKSDLSGISKLLIKQANRQWNKEAHTVSYEKYSEFVKEYSKHHSITYDTYELDQSEVAEMLQICHENHFTMNDLLMAQMYQKTKTNKIIIAVDVRKHFHHYHQNALGNYATALGIVCKSKTTDVVRLTKEVHQSVTKQMKRNQALMLVLACYMRMEPTLLDAAAISALGGFDSKAGKFVGESMFHMQNPSSYSITNLGSMQNDYMKSVLFIPPASPAAKLTLGVVTLNGVLRACTSKNQ